MAFEDATQPGVSNTSVDGTGPRAPMVEGEEGEQRLQRDVDLENMSDRFEAKRRNDLNEAMAEDPGLKANQDAMDAAQIAANNAAPGQENVAAAAAKAATMNAAATAMGETQQAKAPTDGAAEVIPLHEPAPDPSAVPEELQNDPLKDYITMHEGQPHMLIKVNGQDRLLPLDRARAQVQKRVAAEIELQQARETTKTLIDREEQLHANEQALEARINRSGNEGQPPATPVVDVDPTTLMPQAREIISTMFSGTEEQAADKLATVLAETANMRTPTPQAAPVIDVNAIAKQAAGIAVQEVSDADNKKDEIAGFKQFQDDYPEIMSDTNLFRMADGMTDDISEENPAWSPSQVMTEAGKRTRDWLTEMKGGVVTTPALIDPSANADPNANRQANKEGLVPIPRPSGVRHDSSEPEEVPETPQAVLAGIRAARGQPG